MNLKTNLIAILLLTILSMSVVSSSVYCPGDEDEPFIWTLRDESTNQTCIMMTGHFKFKIPYLDESRNFRLAYVPIDCTANVTGDCSSIWTQKIVLAWNENTVEFLFTKNTTTDDVEDFSGYSTLQEIRALIHTNSDQFPKAIDPYKVHNLTKLDLEQMVAPLEMSFYCQSEQIIEFDNKAKLRTRRIQIQAFLNNDPYPSSDSSYKSEFGPISYCNRDALRKFTLTAIFVFFSVLILIAIIILTKRNVRRLNYSELE